MQNVLMTVISTGNCIRRIIPFVHGLLVRYVKLKMFVVEFGGGLVHITIIGYVNKQP